MKISKSIFQKVVRKSFPRAQVISSRKLFGLSGSNIYTLIIERPKKELIFKEILGDDNERDTRKVSYILNLIHRKTNVPVSINYDFDDSKNILNNAYIIEERLPGNNLRDILRKNNINQDSLGRQLGEMLAKIHTIKFEKIGKILDNKFAKPGEKIYPEFDCWKDYIDNGINYLINSIKATNLNLINHSFLKQAESYFQGHRTLYDIKIQPCLLHWDFSLENINAINLNHQCQISGIFDFERAHSGHNEYDLMIAYWNIFYENKYPLMEKSFLKSYRQHGTILKEFIARKELYSLLMAFGNIIYGARNKNQKVFERGFSRAKKILRT